PMRVPPLSPRPPPTTTTSTPPLHDALPISIVFIGRPTCPYCSKFAPKLHKVSTEHKVQVNFVNSEHPDYTNELKDFREKYGVPTVPGILYADGNDVKVRCDSSMTEEEIASFVEAS